MLRLLILGIAAVGIVGCGINNRVLGQNALNDIVSSVGSVLATFGASITEEILGAETALAATDLPQVVVTTASINLDDASPQVRLRLSRPIALSIIDSKLILENLGKESRSISITAPTDLTLRTEAVSPEMVAELFPPNEIPAEDDPEQETNRRIVATVNLVATLLSDDASPVVTIPAGLLVIERSPPELLE